MRSVRIADEVELTFEDYGEETAPLVLLIAGAGAPAQFWPEDFCACIAAQGYRVVRYCHRDTGLSTHFDTPYALSELLNDMDGLLSALGGDNVHLVGHSMGGYMVQIAMMRSVGRFSTVTSISAGPGVSDWQYSALGMSRPRPETWAALIANQPSGDFERDLPGWLASWRFLNGDRAFDEPMAIAYTRALYVGDPRNAQAAVNHVHAMSTVPDSLADALVHAPTPLLVLHGVKDPLVPFDNGAASARLAPRGVLIPLAGAGHMFFCLGVWDEIAAALIPHLKSSR